MRIERTGQVKPLTPRVQKFLVEALAGVSLDDVQSPSQLRADYSCLRGLLAIELKSLEEDGSKRLDNLTQELRERDDWPMFLGSAPIQSFIQNTNDPEGLNRRVLDRIGRAIINHLKKANRQLEEHCQQFSRKNVVRALLLVNEDHELYDPHTVGYLLWHAVRRQQDGKPLYEHVDLIIYMTERHGQVIDNKIAFPTMLVEGHGGSIAPWKGQVADYFIKKWAVWNGVRLYDLPPDPPAFETIDHIPASAPRHERWRTDYRRNPYMKTFTKEHLRERFEEIMLISRLAFLANSPFKPPQEAIQLNMEVFTHMMVEMANRAIPITEFQMELSRNLAAVTRLGLPATVQAWLTELEKSSNTGSSIG